MADSKFSTASLPEIELLFESLPEDNEPMQLPPLSGFIQLGKVVLTLQEIELSYREVFPCL